MSTTKSRKTPPAYAGKAQHAAVRAAVARLFPGVPMKADAYKPSITVSGSGRMIVDRPDGDTVRREAIRVAEVRVLRPSYRRSTTSHADETAAVESLRDRVRAALTAAGWTVTVSANHYSSEVLYVVGPGVL